MQESVSRMLITKELRADFGVYIFDSLASIFPDVLLLNLLFVYEGIDEESSRN
jgi:hypothetical protein